MTTFRALTGYVADAWTAADLRRRLTHLGLDQPRHVRRMYLCGEHPDYIVAACLAVMQRGA